MPEASTAKRYGHVAARMAALVGGLLLGISAAISYFIAGYADDAIDAGTGAAEDALRDGSSGLDDATADEAADWLERASDWLVEGRPDQFRNYCLIAIAAAAVAMLAALVRRPDAVWPEIVWGVAAIAGLAPNLAFDLWFAIWTFTGSLIAAAAAIHYLARSDDHVRRAASATKRAGAAAAPHVGSALARGSKAATDAYQRARGGQGNGEHNATAAAPPLPSAPAAAPPFPSPAAGPAAPTAAAAPAQAATWAPPAGWYADPQGQAAQRYWDGAAWTSHTG
jgi:Protein of unknown function (DUF2510)